MIKLQNISKSYNGIDYVIKDLNLHIEEGQIYTFVGPSGCGKSTTLKMINRLIEPTSGDIYINDGNIREKDPNELRKNIGYVIQEIGLFPHKNIKENISVVPRLYGWSQERIDNRIEELLKTMGLDEEEIYDKYPSELSGGQMQRIGVARALAVDPPIMLMDEPFGAVDPIVREHLQDEFLKLQKINKKTICFVTHDINEAFKMGDKIVIFNEGSIAQCDTPENIVLNPKNDFVRKFVGMNSFTDNLKVISLKKLLDKNCYFKLLEDSDKEEKLRSNGYFINSYSSISNCLNLFLKKDVKELLIIDDSNRYLLSFDNLQKFISEEVGYYE